MFARTTPMRAMHRPFSLLGLPVAQIRAVARLCLWVVMFAALHATLGSWWLGAQGRGLPPSLEVCSAQGLAWLDVQTPDQQGEQKKVPEGVSKPCVWSAAFVLHTAQAAASAFGKVHRAVSHSARWYVNPADPWEDGPSRVLLMSAMRAPPAWGCTHPPAEPVA